MFELQAYDMARHVRRKPAWWLLYIIGVVLVGGIGLIERFVPAGSARTVLECAVVIVAFGLMLLWRCCNRARWM
jgi:hypothetical protein